MDQRRDYLDVRAKNVFKVDYSKWSEIKEFANVADANVSQCAFEIAIKIIIQTWISDISIEMDAWKSVVLAFVTKNSARMAISSINLVYFHILIMSLIINFRNVLYTKIRSHQTIHYLRLSNMRAHNFRVEK